MFFFENHMQNVMEKLVPDSFIKKVKLSLSLDLKCYKVCLYYMSKSRSTKIY